MTLTACLTFQVLIFFRLTFVSASAPGTKGGYKKDEEKESVKNRLWKRENTHKLAFSCAVLCSLYPSRSYQRPHAVTFGDHFVTAGKDLLSTENKSASAKKNTIFSAVG